MKRRARSAGGMSLVGVGAMARRVVVALAAALVAGAAGAQCNSPWLPGMQVIGVDGPVYAIARDAGGDLYVGGHFTIAGGVKARNLARYHPANKTWSAVAGTPGDLIRAIAIMPGGEVMAATDIGTQGVVERWNGTTWAELGQRADKHIDALAVSTGGTLYAGGEFNSIGGAARPHVAWWDGSVWQAAGAGLDGNVLALTPTPGGDVVAGGAFTHSGQAGMARVAIGNQNGWTALGDGFDDAVMSLAAASDGTIFAGGAFTHSGAAARAHVAAWNGGGWNSLGLGVTDNVTALLVRPVDLGYELIVGGDFQQAGGQDSLAFIAAYDSQAGWHGLGTGTSNAVRALALLGSDVIAGGAFDHAGGQPTGQIARFNDQAGWSALNPGIDGPVYCFAPLASGYLIGGQFSVVDGVPANNVARYDGVSWHALGQGFDGAVQALSVSGPNDIVAGGQFTHSGDASRKRIARWNGATWGDLGGGIDGASNVAVYALARMQNGDIAAGGYFDSAGGVPALSLATCHEGVWSQVGDGIYTITRTVYAMAVRDNGDLIIGGSFTLPIGRNLATRQGNSWFFFGLGADGPVRAIQYLPSDGFFIAGDFRFAGGNYTPAMASYDFPTHGWVKVPRTMMMTSGNALGLDPSGDLILGGTFSDGGKPVGRVQRYNQINSWQLVGDDLNDAVYAVLSRPDYSVLAGGAFQSASNVTPAIARWALSDPPQILHSPEDASTCRGGQVKYLVEASGSQLAYRWQHEDGFLSENWNDLQDGTLGTSQIAGSATTQLTINSARANVAGRVRCRVSAGCATPAYSDPAMVNVCSADQDCDGSVTTDDFLSWYGFWSASNVKAETDGLPGLDLGDFFEFLNSYDQGCEA